MVFDIKQNPEVLKKKLIIIYTHNNGVCGYPIESLCRYWLRIAIGGTAPPNRNKAERNTTKGFGAISASFDTRHGFKVPEFLLAIKDKSWKASESHNFYFILDGGKKLRIERNEEIYVDDTR